MLKKNVILTFTIGTLILSVILNFFLFKKFKTAYIKEQTTLIEPIHSSKNIYNTNDSLKNTESILLIGDSRIAQWSPKPDFNSEVINYGMSGETTIQLFYRIKKEIDSYKSNIIIIQTGVNDLKTIGLFPDKKDEIIAHCFTNIENIASMLSQKGKNIIILTIFPHGKISLIRKPIWDDSVKEAISEVNNQLRNISIPGVSVIDCDSILSLDNNLLNPSYSADELHLNVSGYKKLNSYLKPIVNNYIKTNN